MPNDAAISTLNDLIETCKDGEKGFRKAWEETDTPPLKQEFKTMSQDCAKAAAQLEDWVRKLGGKPDVSGTVAGALHRGWIATRTAVAEDDDSALLDEVIRGEEHAVKEYEEAMEKDLPPPVREIVASQAKGARDNLERARRLKVNHGV